MVWTLKLILEQLFQPEIPFLQAAWTLVAGTTEDVLLGPCQDFVHRHVTPQEAHNKQTAA